jgi:hypothetical protein
MYLEKTKYLIILNGGGNIGRNHFKHVMFLTSLWEIHSVDVQL